MGWHSAGAPPKPGPPTPVFCFVSFSPLKIWLPMSWVSIKHQKRAPHPFASPGVEPSCSLLTSWQKLAPMQINPPALGFCVGFQEPEPASWVPVAALPTAQGAGSGSWCRKQHKKPGETPPLKAFEVLSYRGSTNLASWGGGVRRKNQEAR